MARRKRSRVQLHKQITVSEALAQLAQNQINQLTLPAVEVQDPQHEEAAQAENEKSDGDAGDLSCTQFDFESFDSDTESSLEERFQVADLLAGDSCTTEEQLRVALGGNFRNGSSHLVEEDEDEENNHWLGENEVEDVVELNPQEEAMLDMLQLCQGEGTSLQFFDKLVTTHAPTRKERLRHLQSLQTTDFP